MINRKHILINATTAAIGGGLIIALDIIRCLYENPNYKITLLCPDFSIYRKFQPDLEKIFVPRKLVRFYNRWRLDYFWLRNKINTCNPDLLISLGNLPAITNFPQIIFNDNAFVSQKKMTGFQLTMREYISHRLRKFIFHNRIKYVQQIVVQTNHEKNKFEENFNKLPPIKILPPLFPSHISQSMYSPFVLPVKKEKQIRLGCLSYVHGYKNISILSEVLDLAKKDDFPLQIIVTLSPYKTTLYKKTYKLFKKHFNSERAIDLGKIKPEQITGLIEKLDGLILPSLNESYSINILEALHFKKPLFISDREFAREICKDNAIYFNPNLPSDIYSKIYSALPDKKVDRNNTSFLICKPEDLYTLINTSLK